MYNTSHQIHRRLYPVILNEEMHAIAYQYAIVKICQENGYDSFPLVADKKRPFAFLSTKRTIRWMRNAYHFPSLVHKSLESPSNHVVNNQQFINFWRESSLILEIVMTLLLHVWKLRRQHDLSDKSVLLASTSSVFQSLETKWRCGDPSLKISYRVWVHPEVIVRILRQSISDSSFLNLLRQALHTEAHQTRRVSSVLRLSNSIKVALWNLCILEFDNLACSKVSQNGYQSKQNKLFLSCPQSFSRKIRSMIPLYKHDGVCIWPSSICFQKGFEILSACTLQSKFICDRSQYIRYRNTFFLSSQKFILRDSKIQSCLEQIWQRRLGLHTLSSSLFLVKNVSFLVAGCSLHSKERVYQVKVSEIYLLPTIYVSLQYMCVSVPTQMLIAKLAKQSFCTIQGSSKTHPSWSTWRDTKILDQFAQVFVSLLHHYNGCTNHLVLIRIYRLLRLSCAKTLARKHKAGVISVWKDMRFVKRTNGIYLENTELVTSMSKFSSSITFFKKTWHLYALKADSIALSIL